jgi:hypothetical protein
MEARRGLILDHDRSDRLDLLQGDVLPSFTRGIAVV